jgi:hypothetical protein
VAGGELLVGQPLDLQLDAARYDTKMKRFFKPEGDAGGPGRQPQPGAKAGEEDMGEQQAGGGSKEKLDFRFADARKPGVYLLEFYPKPEAGGDGQPERRAFAFNVDTAAESNLLRQSREEIGNSVAHSQFFVPGVDKNVAPNDQQRDLSEGPWLYLLFLLLLVAEQALAVHLSFHIQGTAAPAVSPRPQLNPVG